MADTVKKDEVKSYVASAREELVFRVVDGNKFGTAKKNKNGDEVITTGAALAVLDQDRAVKAIRTNIDSSLSMYQAVGSLFSLWQPQLLAGLTLPTITEDKNGAKSYSMAARQDVSGKIAKKFNDMLVSLTSVELLAEAKRTTPRLGQIISRLSAFVAAHGNMQAVKGLIPSENTVRAAIQKRKLAEDARVDRATDSFGKTVKNLGTMTAAAKRKALEQIIQQAQAALAEMVQPPAAGNTDAKQEAPQVDEVTSVAPVVAAKTRTSREARKGASKTH